MRVFLVGLVLACGPLVLALFSCVSLLRMSGRGGLESSSLCATGAVTISSGYAAYIFLRYSLGPPLNLPVWKDPEILHLAMCFFLGPIGFILSAIAGGRGAPRRVVLPLMVASVVLFLVGLLATAAV